MRIAAILAFGVLGIVLAAPAQALTVSNADAEARKIVVRSGSDSVELVIEPQKTAEPSCQAGCTVELENGEIYEMHGGEEAIIEGGTLFVDAVTGLGGDGGGGTAPAAGPQ
ncbi:MAG TPA: hypothetical protein VFG05_12810 [Methylocella sp.]|nr:hypothetical protein [Methylocella sp.]